MKEMPLRRFWRNSGPPLLAAIGWNIPLFVLLFSLPATLPSCRTARPPAAVAPTAAPATAGDSPTLPPGVVVQPAQSALGKLLGWPRPAAYALPELPARIGKKATITINKVGGDQQNNTAAKNAAAGPGATTVTKPAGPVATAAGDATDQTRAQASANIKGDGNAPVLSNTAPEAPGVGATIAAAIATPVGKVAGVALLCLLGYGVYRLWPLLRRRKSTDLTA